MSKVRVGIIGAGNIARLHALGYANAELSAVCDVDGERARERAAPWGAAKSYTDYRDLLDDPEVDADWAAVSPTRVARPGPGIWGGCFFLSDEPTAAPVRIRSSR